MLLTYSVKVISNIFVRLSLIGNHVKIALTYLRHDQRLSVLLAEMRRFALRLIVVYADDVSTSRGDAALRRIVGLYLELLIEMLSLCNRRRLLA